MKAISGQKTDKKDASGIAKLLRANLIPRSFVPEEPIQNLSRLKKWIASRNKKKNRTHQVLQTAGIKIPFYITDIFGVSGRNLLDLSGEKITAETVTPIVYSGAIIYGTDRKILSVP
ncbi:hypothetical protein [Vagococcus acidifermentans]|uniref:hypothetical protein n=1 Tax=Vagococcus acidifermentans TaxID=564710 RepID=UPI003CCC7CE9